MFYHSVFVAFSFCIIFFFLSMNLNLLFFWYNFYFHTILRESFFFINLKVIYFFSLIYLHNLGFILRVNVCNYVWILMVVYRTKINQLIARNSLINKNGSKRKMVRIYNCRGRSGIKCTSGKFAIKCYQPIYHLILFTATHLRANLCSTGKKNQWWMIRNVINSLNLLFSKSF